MKLNAGTTLPEYFYFWEKTKPDSVFLRQPSGDNFKDFTWQETGQQARKLASWLHSLALPPRSHIGLVSKNCAEWFITDLAIMMAGHVSVPFFPTLTAGQINQVLAHSGCKALFVGKLDDWQSIKPGIPAGMPIVSFPNYNPDPDHLQWEDILVAQQPMTGSPVPKPHDLLTVIYTSGTTGNPKGVMLTYRCFSSVLYAAREFLKMHIPDPRFISYLPLCHIGERGIMENAAISLGATVYFVESLDTFNKNLVAASPTHFGGVPRIWTKLQQGILAKMPRKKLDLLLKIPLLNNLVRKKIRQGLGLAKAECIVAGAAPMPLNQLLWFNRLGIRIQELYGQTESTAIISMNPDPGIRYGTVGKILADTNLKIAPETGEICVKSPHNLIAYYNEPAMTDATIDSEGWLHTGDVGELDKDGYLRITGRVKEMYKTSKGEYVAPAQIELGFAVNVFIEQICVVGENIPQPLALLVLSEAGLAADRQTVSESLLQTLHDLNPTLKPYERVKKMVVLREPWTVENDKMTPTFKIKRKEIEKAFAADLEDWYAREGELIWE